MKIFVTRRLPDSVMARARGMGAELHDSDTALNDTDRAALLRDYDAVVCTLGDRFSADMFAGDPRCRLIANFGVGYNHIDADAAQAAGITVTNTPGVLTDATADLAMALMLMALRRAGEGERMVRADAWPGWTPTQMLGQTVTGRTLGIVGMGRIGQAMARRAHHGFGMQILYYNRSAKDLNFPAQRLDTVEDLAAQADVVAIHAPGGADTRHLFGAAAIAAMKPTGVLINTSRGDVVDEGALIEALESGAIYAAGLDVYEAEPAVPARLRALDNAVLLPHLGSATLEVREAMGNMALDNVEAFVAGRQVPNPV
ncbi:2-hydroxyacid dehydrogenase [Pontivivens nitratireducens]|uniref:D-glycerate dehydrogenase n=1 Tax=Pontivivens nitratireducens TaxID=2758038 RepID=A0A6G7VK92_9RHOB|nr:D-glycerate dehydrogenase [Pontibrevibacter nitratireducens]QIK40286.1 D-glycerate dehydrogenase [Pontibrevibacter nitratireducens]